MPEAKSIDFDTIIKDEYYKLYNSASYDDSTDTKNSTMEYHHSKLLNLPSNEREQYDPNYQGPYDDKKSCVTYSTGDFDMSQMYSRSWSTIAPTVVSKGAAHWLENHVVFTNELYSSRTDKDCKEDSEIMVVPIEKMRSSTKEKEDGVGLDGLSLVESVVGDDRSYVEDY